MQAGRDGLDFIMDAQSPAVQVVKEFRFFPESEIVTIVFVDDTSAEFQGAENYHKARHACLDQPQPESAQLELTGTSGGISVMTVPKGTPHETFEA
jgi:hypothetical protein